MREEVEGLEDHADVRAQVGQRLALLRELPAVDGDRAGLEGPRRLIVRQSVDFPEPDGPIRMTTSPLPISEVDVLEDVQVAVVLC